MQCPTSSIIAGLRGASNTTRACTCRCQPCSGPNGKLLVTGGDDQTARLWNVQTGQPWVVPLLAHNGWVWGVAFGPDGQVVATGGADGVLRLWDAFTGKPYGPVMAGHPDPISGVGVSPDGSRVATASSDHTVRLWDVSGPATGSSRQLIGHTGPVVAVAF